MKKSVLFIVFLLLFSISFVSAAVDNTSATVTDTAKVDKAYNCLQGKVANNCQDLSVEEKIFSLLAIGECKDELMFDALNAECWPDTGCKLKTTAQAILALDKTTKSTLGAESWLITQNSSPVDVVWYLQIESGEQTTCTVTYDQKPYKVIIKDDKTINNGAGHCLTLSTDDWWLKVSPGCYDREFEITCDRNFRTDLLFKRKASSVLHVSEEEHSASADGKTIEKINSACFIEGGKCNYEGSLWAAMVLDYKGHDISAYLPYLITMSEENPKYLPEGFLYDLTQQDDYRTNLLLKQKARQYWLETGDKFYDTAVALLPFRGETPVEKINTQEWLLEIQDNEGCWQGNIRNTAFLLASIWPRHFEPGTKGCIDSGYFCTNEVSCEGNILSDYACGGLSVCCDALPTPKTCAEQGGTICESGENCVQGISAPSATDIGIGQSCCIGGSCEEPPPISECLQYSGVCRSSCASSEIEESAYSCDFPSEVCCLAAPASEGGSYMWIFILLILIVLVVLGIVFRDKLRPYWHKLKSKFTKSGPGSGTPGPRPGMPPRPGPRPGRRIMPPSQRRAIRPAPSRGPASGPLNDVLGKLKQMSK